MRLMCEFGSTGAYLAGDHHIAVLAQATASPPASLM